MNMDITTGIDRLDYAIGGFTPGRLTVIGAHFSVLENVAFHIKHRVEQRGKRVFSFISTGNAPSPEMREKMPGDLIIAANIGVEEAYALKTLATETMMPAIIVAPYRTSGMTSAPGPKMKHDFLTEVADLMLHIEPIERKVEQIETYSIRVVKDRYDTRMNRVVELVGVPWVTPPTPELKPETINMIRLMLSYGGRATAHSENARAFYEDFLRVYPSARTSSRPPER